MRNQDIVLENVRIMFKNFSGAKGQYNPQGNRTFSVVLTPDVAQALAADGWNVRTLAPRNPDDPPLYILPVAVSYRLYPPKVVLIFSNGKRALSEDELSILDFSEFTNIDLIINPSHYDFNGRVGVKAYLRSGYFTLYEDELEKKYMDIPDTAKNAIMPNEY